MASSLTLIKHVLSTSDAAALLEQQGVADSDLLPGQYEGGCLTACSGVQCNNLQALHPSDWIMQGGSSSGKEVWIWRHSWPALNML